MIAVTGANGYIAQATLKWLAREGLNSVGISRSNPKWSVPSTIQWRLTSEASPGKDAFTGCKCVIHLAGRAHTKIAVIDGRDVFDQYNRQLAIDTAISAHMAGVERFVFVSTIGVHGNFSYSTIHIDSPLCLDTPYAKSKWAAEQSLVDYCKSVGMSLCIVRPPMVYGPNCPGNFPRLLKLVASGLPLPFCSMNSVRSFVNVDNLASFLTVCVDEQMEMSSVFIIGDGSDWSTAQLVEIMSDALGKKNRSFHFPVSLLHTLFSAVGKEREFSSLSRPMLIDSSFAREKYSWVPPVSPIAGLIRAVTKQ